MLSHLALKRIQAVTGYIRWHEAHVCTVMEEQLRLESGEQIRIKYDGLGVIPLNELMKEETA